MIKDITDWEAEKRVDGGLNFSSRELYTILVAT